MAEETPKIEAAPSKGGKKKLLVIVTILIAVLGSAAGWFILKNKGSVDQTASSEDDRSASKTQVQEPETQPVRQPGTIPPRGILVPLTRHAVAFKPFNPNKRGDQDKIMLAELDRTADKLTEVAEADRIVVNLVGPSGKGIVVLEIGMRVHHLDVIRRINERNAHLFDQIASTFSRKTEAEANRSGFRDRVQSELLDVVNRALGFGSVTQIVLFHFRLK